jgi:hypothetical protein
LGSDPSPLLSGVPSALHERWPVFFPKPVSVSPGLHGTLLPGARWRSWWGHRRFRPRVGPGRGPVHRSATSPGSGERGCGQQARHLCGAGDRGSSRAGGGAPCPACGLPGAPGAWADLSGRYQATGNPGKGAEVGGHEGGRTPARAGPGAVQRSNRLRSAALRPPRPAPSAGPTPRGERACPPSTRGLGPSAPH